MLTDHRLRQADPHLDNTLQFQVQEALNFFWTSFASPRVLITHADTTAVGDAPAAVQAPKNFAGIPSHERLDRR